MPSVNTGRSYGGMTADERDAQRRNRLRNAALALIGTKGYAASTIPRMCADAKVSTRHFYEMYSSKEDLFVDLYDALTAQSYVRVAESLAASADQPFRERIPGAVIAYLDPMLRDARVARISFVEIMGASARIEKLRIEYRETLINLVADEGNVAVKRGEIEPHEWRFVALALVGAVTAIVYDWALNHRGVSRDVLEARLTAVAVDLLTR